LKKTTITNSFQGLIPKDAELFSVKKGTILLQKGEKAKHGFFVVKGCLKSFVIDSSGKEHILNFAPENWIISDLNSLLNNAESSLTIKAIEDTEYYLINSKNFELAFESPSKDLIEKQVQMLIKNIIATNKRLISLMSATGEERYLEFIATYPSLIQRLPLKLIASYLAITPEFLSRIRKKLAKK
jgi:CRP-like cAMP-binding protein